MKKFFLAAPPLAYTDAILLMARLWFGIMMIKNGKYIFSREEMVFFENLFRTHVPFPFPVLMAYLAKTAEFIGGIFLCLGFLTRFASSLTAFTMLVASFTANKGQLFDMYGALTFSLFCLSLWFLFFGPGKWSLDFYIFDRHCRRPLPGTNR